jgi:hypothetical protein
MALARGTASAKEAPVDSHELSDSQMPRISAGSVYAAGNFMADNHGGG